MTTWPNAATLPQNPEWQNYSEQPQDNAIRFQADVGPSKDRRRGTGAATTMQLSFQMTGTQWDSLLTFYKTTLKEVSIFTGSGSSGFAGTFKFGGPPQRSGLAPDLFRVVCPLMKLT